MIFYYGRSGFFADIALSLNILLIFGILAGLGAVLTLPGIAGIVLTIGISVDANVLIFERVREELRKGKGDKKSVDDGFNNALSSILDANITTGLTAMILFIFGIFPGYIRMAYKSLSLPIMLHGINNSFAFFMAYYFY